MPSSRRVCVDELYYVDEGTGLCRECPPAMLPVILFLAYLCAIVLTLLLLYGLFRWSWQMFRRSVLAVRWVIGLHAGAFKRQGPAKFKVPPTSSCNAPAP